MSTILIIDDERLVRLGLRKVLEREGHEVVEAANGEEAVNLYPQAESDLVITDILMPKKEGIETMLEIRRLDPDIRIIAISGGGQTGKANFLDFAEQLGADRVLEKPIGRDTLVNAVNDMLALRRAS